MPENFVEELRWRGMIHDTIPKTEEHLMEGVRKGYVGFDPTADSLHIGNLVPILLLVRFQRAGHQPIALVGGATGMVGDPSGKSEERNLLSEEVLNHNISCIQQQLARFLDFDAADNPAKLVNNYDWFKSFSFLDFIRDVGKHISVNYMMAKDSVKKRLESGISFTEFSYQLVQGYDFLWLHENMDCTFQMGGSDQWGNITTGTELIRRMKGGEAFALTCPLLTKSDGGKFGKTEKGNVWLDPDKTSPYQFLQFWVNTADEDISRYMRTFSLKSKAEIEALEKEHQADPQRRIMQHELGKELTVLVHSTAAYESALAASQILFGKSTSEQLKSIEEKDFLSIFDGVPQITLTKGFLKESPNMIDFLSEHTSFLKSKSEARRALEENSISINKEKVAADYIPSETDLIRNKYIVLQRGKKNYFLVKVEE